MNGRYSMDFDDLERRISHETNTLILCNPQNPTGNCWSAEDLTRLGEICLRRRVIVLADEIHCDWVTKGNKYTPFSSLPEQGHRQQQHHVQGREQVVRPRGDEARVDVLGQRRPDRRASRPTTAPISPRSGMVANKAAYTPKARTGSIRRWPTSTATTTSSRSSSPRTCRWSRWSSRRARICAGWTSPASPTRSARSSWPPRRTARRRRGAADVTPETMVERYFVKHAKVHLNQGASYGFGGANHMRMNIATSRKLVELALTNMANALRNT